MGKYVVAVLSFFDNELKQFKVEAESDYHAVGMAMIEFSNEKYRKDEIEFQNSGDYPANIEDLEEHYINGEIVFSVIEVSQF